MDNNINYQMFFPPCSPPTIMPTTNHQVYNYATNFHESSNGLLNNNSTVFQRSSSSELVKEEHDVSQSSGDAFSRNDDDLIGKSSGKKKEKKVKKPRCAFQTRSRVDILDDGYRWRKYGQKAVKNNKFPRSYYRCTHQGCNVKKQVQRLTKDETIVVTTYEGMHNHPIEKPSDNFEQILSQMQICPSF